MTQPSPRVGEQLACPDCTVKVVVVRTPGADGIEFACDGTELVPAGSVTQPPRDPGAAPGTLIGKRYVDADETVELLCTSAGSGTLSYDGADLTIKSAKPLPASD